MFGSTNFEKYMGNCNRLENDLFYGKYTSKKENVSILVQKNLADVFGGQNAQICSKKNI